MKRRRRIRSFWEVLPVYGSVATGIVYFSIGVIAILSFFKLKHGGADESSLLVFLNDYVAGKILIWIILLGMAGYFFWRFYEAIKDPYGYGNDKMGIAKRIAAGFSSIADGLICYYAVTALTGGGGIQENGVPTKQRTMVGNILDSSYGDVLITAIGIIVVIVAIFLLMYVITNAYKQRLDIDRLKQHQKNLIHVIAWVGYFARSIIIGINGFSCILADVEHDAQVVVNTDKAFDFIGDHIGGIPFNLEAVGVICYGLYMFILAWYFDPDKD